jgi:F-type H+-transporting ATPase subunit delta
MATAVANRYARALADVVTGPGSAVKPEDTVAQLRAIEEILAESAELRTALLTPAIQNSRKRAVMAKLMDQVGASQWVKNFIFVLIDRRRVGILSEIRNAFELLVDDRLGFARAEITSAMPLDEQRVAGLASELERVTGKKMRLHYSVEPDLLGGVIARIGSTVYDGSLRGQLQELRRRLTEQPAAE